MYGRRREMKGERGCHSHSEVSIAWQLSGTGHIAAKMRSSPANLGFDTITCTRGNVSYLLLCKGEGKKEHEKGIDGMMWNKKVFKSC